MNIKNNIDQSKTESNDSETISPGHTDIFSITSSVIYSHMTVTCTCFMVCTCTLNYYVDRLCIYVLLWFTCVLNLIMLNGALHLES